MQTILSQTVDEIYACHILEHFGRGQIVNVLAEWNRVMKMGSTLRIAVPDFESSVKWYLEHPTGLNQLTGLLHGGQGNSHDYHYLSFDFFLLSRLLNLCGFTQVERYDANTFLPAGFDDYSLSYKPHKDVRGTLMSLNVRATKVRHVSSGAEVERNAFLSQLIGAKLLGK